MQPDIDVDGLGKRPSWLQRLIQAGEKTAQRLGAQPGAENCRRHSSSASCNTLPASTPPFNAPATDEDAMVTVGGRAVASAQGQVSGDTVRGIEGKFAALDLWSLDRLALAEAVQCGLAHYVLALVALKAQA